MVIIEYISYSMVPLLILIIIFFAFKSKIPAYDSFIEGTSESFSTILKIFPNMLAVVLAINLFKISGSMDILTNLLSPILSLIRVPAELVPIGVMRSVSGGGAIALLTDILNSNGPDSTIGLIASTIMGSSDTTLYVLAIYVATTKIRNIRFAMFVGLLCDLIAFLLAVYFYTY